MRNAKVILVGSFGRPSMKSLFAELGKDVAVVEKVEEKRKELIKIHLDSSKFSVGKKLNKADFSIENSVVIRWGNRIPMNMHNCVVYNQSSAINNASNKKRARTILNEKKVSIPKLITKENFKEEDLPIVARPSYHCKCKNIILLRTKEKFLEHYERNEPRGWYYSKIIDKDFEYRIHCAHGKVLSISEKPRPKNKETFGWGYSVVEEEWRVLHWNEYKAVWCKHALNAVAALGLDFGAVDIIVKDKKAYVLEVNTAGSLTESPYLRKRYSQYFNWLLNSKARREHWDFNKFEAGKSLAWKNGQF